MYEDGIKMLICLIGIVKNWNNRIFFAVNNKLHQIVAQFAHIECPQNLKCSLCLTIPKSTHTINFHAQILKALTKLSSGQEDIQEYLIQSHAILDHLSSIIISYVINTMNLHSLTFQNSSNNYINLSKIQVTSSNLVTEAIRLIWSLLNNQAQLSLFALYVPNLIQSFIALSSIERNIHNETNKRNEDAFIIRHKSLLCLNRIQTCSSEQSRFIYKLNFINAIVDNFSSGGGNCEENNHFNVIRDALICISNLFSKIYHNNVAKVAFLDALEQIEVNGGIEEIIIHCCNAQYQNKDVSLIAYNTNKWIVNNFKDYSNGCNW